MDLPTYHLRQVRVALDNEILFRQITCLRTPQGVIGVTSAGRGRGSTFYFELPMYGPDYLTSHHTRWFDQNRYRSNYMYHNVSLLRPDGLCYGEGTGNAWDLLPV